MKTLICIGGPLNGQRLTIPDNRDIVYAVDDPPMSAYVQGSFDPETPLTFEQTTYNRARLYMGVTGRLVEVLREESLSDFEADRLLWLMVADWLNGVKE